MFALKIIYCTIRGGRTLCKLITVANNYNIYNEYEQHF